jgi:hypothetical protein
MHPALYAARLGLSRGWTEFRLYLTNPQDLVWNRIVSPSLITCSRW